MLTTEHAARMTCIEGLHFAEPETGTGDPGYQVRRNDAEALADRCAAPAEHGDIDASLQTAERIIAGLVCELIADQVQRRDKAGRNLEVQ